MFCDVSSHVDLLASQCSRKANFWKVSFMYSTRSKLFGAMMLSTVATLMAFYTFLTAVKFSGSQVSLLWLPYPLYVWYFTYCIVLIRLVSKVTLVNTQTSKANDSWMSLNYHQSRLDWKANCIIAALAWTATMKKKLSVLIKATQFTFFQLVHSYPISCTALGFLIQFTNLVKGNFRLYRRNFIKFVLKLLFLSSVVQKSSIFSPDILFCLFSTWAKKQRWRLLPFFQSSLKPNKIR